jgi:PAS domain S-box-containing protein
LKVAGDAIVTVDNHAQVTSWNDAAARLFGFSEQEAMSTGLALVIPSRHRARHVAGFHAAMASGELAHHGQPSRVEGTTSSGEVIPLLMSLGLLRGENNQPIGVVAVLRPSDPEPSSFI